MMKIPWRTEEVEIILENHESMSIDNLLKLLPNRSKKSLQRKVEQLQLAGELEHKYVSKHSKVRKRKDSEWNDLWED